MNCLKCGRETAGEQVFCEDCLLDMEKHPVKPGTVVLLPRRRDTSAAKKSSKRRSPSLEEQVRVLKQRVRVQVVLLYILLAMILALAYPAGKYLTGNSFKIGQNYTSITPTTVPAETN